jgi:type I restriction enzyme, S subunit
MKSKYKLLGSFIREVVEKNSSLQVKRLQGVSISKIFIPSIANVIGTDMSKYKIVRTGQFAYGPVTSRNGEKISIALLEEEDCIISTSYTVFEIVDNSRLLPEYLMMWFRRPEFDRYARYMSHGSVRELFGWDELCAVELPIPSIQKQREIVQKYHTILSRSKVNDSLNQTLASVTQAVFESWFINFDPVIDNAIIEGNPIPDIFTERAETRRQSIVNSIDQLEQNRNFPAKFVFTQEIGWIPDGWSVGKIGDIANVIDCLHSKKPDRAKSNTGQILLQLNNICNDGIMNPQEKYYISEEDYKKWISRIEVHEGDCVITNVGRVGAASIVPKGIKAAIGRNITAIRLKPDHSCQAFLITLLTSRYMEKEIQNRTDMGTIMNALNVKSIPQLCFPQSGNIILELFEDLVFPILKKRQHIKDENISLQNVQNTLLPELMFSEH